MKKTALILVLVMILLFSSCGGYVDSDYIEATDWISRESISIDLEVKRTNLGGTTQNFAVDKTLNELADYIAKSDSSLSVNIYRDTYIEIRTPSNIFLIKPVKKGSKDKEDEYRYLFFSPNMYFTKKGEGMNHGMDMYIPYHLVKDALPVAEHDLVTHPETGTDAYPQRMECEAVGTIEEFYDFYHHIAHCEVEREGNVLRVTTERDTATLTFLAEGDTSKVTFFVE